MKKLFRPFMDAVHNQLEGMKFYRAPRAGSTKARRYEQIDLTREFEIRQQRREVEKKKRLEELYKSHDEKASRIHSISPIVDSAQQSDLSEGEGMTTDGDGEGSKRKMMLQ